jgi:hypothetical protein
MSYTPSDFSVPVVIGNLPTGNNPANVFDTNFNTISSYLANVANQIVNVPAANNTTAGLADLGTCIVAGGDITIPSNIFGQGNVFSIYNSTSNTINIVQGFGLTLRLAGTSLTGSRTLQNYGLCTLWCNSGIEIVITGSGIA